jgi:hypothetical protein
MKKTVLIVVILLVVAILGVGIYIFTHREKLVTQIVGKALGSLQTTIISQLPTEEKKAEVEAIFKEVGEKVKTGSIGKKEFEDLGSTLQKSFADKKLDEKELEVIIQKLKSMAGQTEGNQ